jgi:hypothetical protein
LYLSAERKNKLKAITNRASVNKHNLASIVHLISNGIDHVVEFKGKFYNIPASKNNQQQPQIKTKDFR